MSKQYGHGQSPAPRQTLSSLLQSPNQFPQLPLQSYSPSFNYQHSGSTPPNNFHGYSHPYGNQTLPARSSEYTDELVFSSGGTVADCRYHQPYGNPTQSARSSEYTNESVFSSGGIVSDRRYHQPYGNPTQSARSSEYADEPVFSSAGCNVNSSEDEYFNDKLDAFAVPLLHGNKRVLDDPKPVAKKPKTTKEEREEKKRIRIEKADEKAAEKAEKAAEKAAEKENKKAASETGTVKNWSIEEAVNLVVAYRQALNAKAPDGERTEQFYNRVHREYVDANLGTSRLAQACTGKMKQLIQTYKFIVDWNAGRANGSTGQLAWFEMEMEDRKKNALARRITDTTAEVFYTLDNIMGHDATVSPPLLLDSMRPTSGEGKAFTHAQKVGTGSKKGGKLDEEAAARKVERERMLKAIEEGNILQERSLAIMEKLVNAMIEKK